MFKITYSKEAIKNLSKMPKQWQERICEKLFLLAQNPYAPNNNVKMLGGGKGYRLRVGDYRAVYYLHNNALIIEVVKIKHRREVYL